MIADRYMIYRAIRGEGAEWAREAMKTRISHTHKVFISH